jgi:hypothetical protein
MCRCHNPETESAREFNSPQRSRLLIQGAFVLAALWISMLPQSLLASATSLAQTSTAPAAQATPQHKQPSIHKRPRHATKAAQPVAQPASPPMPVAPPPPNWPANDQPTAASVVWDSKGLLVVASNSSLTQILKEVSLDTGIKIEGLGKDQRIFGTYGPASASDVLSQLLDGTSYNVLMIGDQGKGTPRRVVLTSSTGSSPPPGNTNPKPQGEANADATDESPPEEPEPPQAQRRPNVYAPGAPARTQQQLIEEMQERQRQIDEERQQQQQQDQTPH